jgi:hypothetical protein
MSKARLMIESRLVGRAALRRRLGERTRPRVQWLAPSPTTCTMKLGDARVDGLLTGDAIDGGVDGYTRGRVCSPSICSPNG